MGLFGPGPRTAQYKPMRAFSDLEDAENFKKMLPSWPSGNWGSTPDFSNQPLSWGKRTAGIPLRVDGLPSAPERASSPMRLDPSQLKTFPAASLKPEDIAKGSKATLRSVKPFVTNLVNALRTPPVPQAPVLDAPITLAPVNMEGSRVAIGREFSAADRAADRSLDENSAIAVKGNNLARKLSELNTVNEREANTNSQIRNQEAMTNASIAMGNTRKLDAFHNTLTERQIAQQTQQSANLANAMDKSILIDQEDAKRNLEVKKLGMILGMDKDGVFERYLKKLKEMGDDPLNFYGGKKGKYGGSMGTIFKNLKSIHNGIV